MASKEAKTRHCVKLNDEMSLSESEPAKKRRHKRQFKNYNENQSKCVRSKSKATTHWHLNESLMPEPVKKKAHKALDKKEWESLFEYVH